MAGWQSVNAPDCKLGTGWFNSIPGLQFGVMAERLNPIRSAPFFEGIYANVMTRRAVLEAARADVIFCCVDSLRARMVADRLRAVTSS